jgi:transcriptional regulator with XRE-family HTH domain
MPRPSKRVSPDTLGGLIRSARQNLHLSLAEVAGVKYSTSLISQIERNRIDPSLESLQYLSERLKIPLEDLTTLAQQYRETEVEANRYKSLDDRRIQASQLLAGNRPRRALELLLDMNVAQIPNSLRWRIIALRGQCHFSLRQFQLAQRDFLSAVAMLSESMPQDQIQEALTLRLHLAAATRELGQLEAAYQQYQEALSMMNVSTPVRFVAETHWGMALVVFELASNSSDHGGDGSSQSDSVQEQKRTALKHAESAHTLYSAIDETLRAALLDCQIALIEQSLGNPQAASKRLHRVLEAWAPTIDETHPPEHLTCVDKSRRYGLKERANVVSAAACYLASVELEERQCEKALDHIQLALDAGKSSYRLRRAEAYMMKGQILARRNIHDPEAEEAFHAAILELEPTDRVAAKIRAYDLLGRHLLKQGREKEGDQQLNIARKLANIHTTFSTTTSAEDSPPNA